MTLDTAISMNRVTATMSQLTDLGQTEPRVTAQRWTQSLRRWEESLLRHAAHAAAGLVPQSRSSQLFVLAYHRVCRWNASQKGPEPTWNVTPERLRNQLEGILAAGFQPIRVVDLARSVISGAAIPARAFAVTFDDGYATVATEALQILETLRIPATIFVPTACLDRDTPMPFDDWRGKGRGDVPAEYWRCLTTAECRELLRTGWFDLGSHTHSHADYRNNMTQFHSDLSVSLSILRDRLGVSEVAFSYPYGVARWGFCNSQMRRVLAQAGLLCAFTWEPHAIQVDGDRFAWGRIPVRSDDDATRLLHRMNDWYGKLRDITRSLTGPLRPSGAFPQTPQPDWWHVDQGEAT